jgi:hypothetical protein
MPNLERGIGIGCVRRKESKTHKTTTMSISQASKRNWDWVRCVWKSGLRRVSVLMMVGGEDQEEEAMMGLVGEEEQEGRRGDGRG